MSRTRVCSPADEFSLTAEKAFEDAPAPWACARPRKKTKTLRFGL